MKINKGIIKNVNKRLFTGVMIFTISTTALMGCSHSLEYVKNNHGELVCVNKVNHRYIEDYKVVVFEIDGNPTTFITKVIENNGNGGKGPYCKRYYNIFGDQLIYDSLNKDSNLKIIEEEYLISYLVKYDKVKSEYSENDLKEVLELIKSDYQTEKNKELIKGK